MIGLSIILHLGLYLPCFSLHLPSLHRPRITTISLKMTSEPHTTPFSPWVSAVSSQSDLQAAINEALQQVKAKHDVLTYHTAVFFVSSAYEAAAFSYDLITEGIATFAPNIKQIIGCTTGGVIGAEDVSTSQKPIEIENRASLSILLLSGSYAAQVTHYDTVTVEALANRTDIEKTGGKTGLSFILATDSTKPHLTRFMNQLSSLDGMSDCFGALASSVSSYHKPKLFTLSESNRLERLTDGLIVLNLAGNLKANFFIAKSCVPMGPMFEVTASAGNEILTLRRYNASSTTSEEALPPLVQLDRILQECSPTEKYWLTRELIFASVQKSPSELTASGEQSVIQERDFFSQKPSAFNPYSGSIMAPSRPVQGGTFQFCVRNGLTTKSSVLRSQRELSRCLSQLKSPPLLSIVLNSVDRGSKSFRYQSWESIQIYFNMKDAGFEIPVVGMFSTGAFARLTLSSSQTTACITEADSIFAVISEDSAPIDSSSSEEPAPPLDVMTEFDLKHFSDENAKILVDKTAEVSNTVRVAGLDYFVPDKMPQARFVLEDLVWVRLKDADRMKERFPMKRALTQAKVLINC